MNRPITFLRLTIQIRKRETEFGDRNNGSGYLWERLPNTIAGQSFFDRIIVVRLEDENQIDCTSGNALRGLWSHDFHEYPDRTLGRVDFPVSVLFPDFNLCHSK